MNNKTKIILLGTGTPNAEVDKFGAGIAVVVNEQPYIVDCGAGIVRRVQAASKNGIKALKVNKLNRLFITHLHSDHTVGYPDIIFSPWVLEREEPLFVVGPSGLRDMTKNLMKAYKEDIRVRLNGLEPINTTGYLVKVKEISDTKEPVYIDKNIKVYAFRQCHGSWSSYGYRFVTQDKVIVISGDTAPGRNLEMYKNCDILIHEVYSSKGLDSRPEAWKKYHSHMHTSTKQLADIAVKVKPKILLLYHQLYFGVSDEMLVAEITKTYNGRVISGTDLFFLE